MRCPAERGSFIPVYVAAAVGLIASVFLDVSTATLELPTAPFCRQ